MIIRSGLVVATIAVLMISLVILFVFLVVDSGTTKHAGTKMIIDHDGGADDAMAIFMALLYEKYYHGPKVVGLTTTHGNVGENQVFINTEKILNVADRKDIPIYRGSAYPLIDGIVSDYYFGFDGLGDNPAIAFDDIPAQEEHAALALIEMSKKHQGELVVVTIGALTNIALAVKIDPKFLSRLSQIYVAAGHIYGENYTKPEFNAAMDAEAYRIVTDHGDPEKITLIAFSQVLDDQKISNEWRKDVLGSIKTNIMQAQNMYERISLNSSSYWSLLDPSAMAIALDESSVVDEVAYTNNSIILCGEQRGLNTNSFTTIEEANVRAIYKVNKKPYQDLLYDIFSAELLDTNKRMP